MSVRHEADLLGIGLLGHGQADLLRDPADLLLGVVPQGHEGRGELVLAEPVEHVGLVLGGMQGLFDRVSAVIQADDVGVVAGGDAVRFHDLCRVEHFFPLEEAVAFDAGVGRPAAEVAVYKRIHDLFGKFLHAVESIVADAELLSDAAGVVNLAAAALGAVSRIPGAEGHTADFISFFLQQVCRNGAVHTSGQADKYSFHNIDETSCVLSFFL